MADSDYSMLGTHNSTLNTSYSGLQWSPVLLVWSMLFLLAHGLLPMLQWSHTHTHTPSVPVSFHALFGDLSFLFKCPSCCTFTWPAHWFINHTLVRTHELLLLSLMSVWLVWNVEGYIKPGHRSDKWMTCKRKAQAQNGSVITRA